MLRFGLISVLLATTVLFMGGCPTGTTGGGSNLPPGDPTPNANALLSLNASVSILQRNTAGILLRW
ncbi:MAG: hypothetical protein HZB38_09275 [Planctomycetes bacterium]|nr:hypothetical protein [Planctomycetota bacterium]